MGNNIAVQNDPVLTRIMHGYMPLDMQFIAQDILPKIPVTSQKGDIPQADTNYLRLHYNLVDGASKTPTIYSTFTKATGWNTEDHSIQALITKQDGKNWNNNNWKTGQSQVSIQLAKQIKKTMLISREKALADVLQATGTITQNTTLSGADQWSDYSGSDPIKDIETGRDAVYATTGKEVNTGIMNRAVYRQLINSPKIKETVGAKLQSTVPIQSLTLEQLKMALDLDNIFVGRVLYESALKGQTSSLAAVWGKSCTLAFINPNPKPTIYEDSLGYSFELTSLVADRYSVDDPKHGKYVREEWEYDDVLLKVTAAYLIKDAVA